MITNYIGEPDIVSFSKIINLLRDFFRSRNFTEVHTQDRLSILAACEDPKTVATFNYAGEKWPLPQTGQMWLEYELLSKPRLEGVFCVSTSYRNEPNPIPGRHKILFPMFEFETKGDIEEMEKLEEDLLEHLGFKRNHFTKLDYEKAAKHYKAEEISSAHEKQMEEEFGPTVFLRKFPEHTSPFWNMKRSESGYAHKIDVIIGGMETIGSAERSTDRDEMRRAFQAISDGGYAGLLYDLFGKERVEKELEEFLSLPFIPRFGGGIGVTRLVQTMKKYGLLEQGQNIGFMDIGREREKIRV